MTTGSLSLQGLQPNAPVGTGVPAQPPAGPRARRGPAPGAPAAELEIPPDSGTLDDRPGAPDESSASRGFPGPRPGRVCCDCRRAGEELVPQQWGEGLGTLTQVTSGLCRKSSMSSETVTSMLRLRPPAPRPASPSPAPRHKAAVAASGGRGAAAARARETKAGRESTFRGFGGPAPRPGLGEGEGPPLGEEQCGQRPRPSAALGGRRAASRCRGQAPGLGRGRGCAGCPEGAAARTCVGGGGVPDAGTWGGRRAPTPSAPSARLGPQHLAPLCACASATGLQRQVRAGALERGSKPVLPPGGGRPGCPARRSRPGYAARWGPSGAHQPETGGPRQVQPPRCSQGPARLRGGRAKPACLRCRGRSRGRVERRPGSQRRKVCVEFRP